MIDNDFGLPLDAIGRYCDAAPRPTSAPEEIGPFTLFLASGAFPFYARPRLGTTNGFHVEDVEAVRARQVESGVPESFEWIAELAPGLADVLTAAGLVVERRPLLALDRPLDLPAPAGVSIEFLPSDSPLEVWASVVTAVDLGFSAGGTAVGVPGPVERDAMLARADRHRMAYFRGLAADGLLHWAVAEDSTGPVGGGSYHPRRVELGDGGVRVLAELTGIGTMPSTRRRGIGAAVVCRLVAHAREHGVEGVFMAATDDAVARVYERAGFRRIGTACEAVPA